MQTKTCTKCGIDKPVNEFSMDSHGKFGRKGRCKECIKQYDTIHSKLYYKKNRHKLLEQSKSYYANNKEERVAYSKQYYTDNIAQVRQKNREYNKTHKEMRREYWAWYNKNIREYTKEDADRQARYYNAHKEEYRIRQLSLDRTAQKWRWTSEYMTWKASVYIRDNYTCQRCDVTNCVIHAHHIRSAKDFPELRLEVDNGICLCAKCHKLIHKKKAQVPSAGGETPSEPAPCG